MFQPILSPYFDFQLHYPKQKEIEIPIKIVIYSPYNCGSNLLQNFLLKLFPHIEYHLESLPWKHTLQPSYLQDHLHILIIKNPFSWFLSMIKSPYDFEWDGVYHLLDQKEILFHTKDEGTKSFENIYKIWIQYYKLYLDFLKKTGHPYVLLLTYEDLLYQSEEVMEFFSRIWKIPISQENRREILKKPSKNHGYCHSYEEALQVNDIHYLKSKYDQKYIFSFFQEIQNISILPIHQQLWKFHHFQST